MPASALPLAASSASPLSATSAGDLGAHRSVQDSAGTARRGAGWLSDQITATGGHLDSFGFPDPPNTAYAVVGLHAAGVGRRASAEAIRYLKTELGVAVQYDDGSDNPGTLGYYILAAVSAGQNPYRFGGSAPRNNLVHRLLATERTSGPDRGLFGSGDPTYDGAFRQGLALAALKAARVPLRRARPAASWLIRQQCPTGLWVAYRLDVSAPCAAVDPETFAGPDTNDSSLAVQGLAAFHLYPRRAATLRALHAVQSTDGGFPYLAAPGRRSDPNSTALVIQALLADGVSAAIWRRGSATALSALAGYQLRCAAPPADRGAFFYPDTTGADVLATVQAVPAAAGLTLSRVRARRVSWAVPHEQCAGAGSSAGRGLTGRQLQATTTLAGHAGACTGSTGVTVSVDFTAFGKGVTTRCAPGTPATGVAALQQAGFTPAGTQMYGLAFVCRINSLPSTSQQSCVRTPAATAYWAYYHANAGATKWTYSSAGASSYKPLQGSIDAWAFGNGASPSKTPAQVRAS